MSAIGWQGKLSEATDPEEVCRVVESFLAGWTPEAFAQLPTSCKPPEPIELRDVSPYALTLIRQLGIGERSSAPRLHEMTTFFTKAALRLAQIASQAAVVLREERSKRPD